MKPESEKIDKSTYWIEYYKNNKDKFKENQQRKTTCEHCNKIITISNYPRHIKTKLCKRKQEYDKAKAENRPIIMANLK